MAFSRLQLHEVNVTAVRGSVNVCVCLLQGAKLLQMSICGVHNPPEPTHTCAALLLPPLTHICRNPPQNLQRSLHTCAARRVFFWLQLRSGAICIKTSHLFSSCHLDVAAARSVIST